jgi:hypothetical protein
MVLRESGVSTGMERISFRTTGHWLVRELEELLLAVDAIYNGLLLAFRLEQTKEPMVVKLRIALGSGTDYLGHRVFTGEAGHTQGLLQDALGSMPNPSRLAVATVRMSSPGLVSFEGLGEVMKEFRELIKDFWYRNSQERQKGKLEIEYVRDHVKKLHARGTGRASGELSREIEGTLIQSILTAISKLEELEAEGLLPELPDHLDEAS